MATVNPALSLKEMMEKLEAEERALRARLRGLEVAKSGGIVYMAEEQVERSDSGMGEPVVPQAEVEPQAKVESQHQDEQQACVNQIDEAEPQEPTPERTVLDESIREESIRQDTRVQADVIREEQIEPEEIQQQRLSEDNNVIDTHLEEQPLDSEPTSPSSRPQQPLPQPKQPLHLPDEILLEILTYITLTPKIAQQTLAATAQLNHQWNAATLPLLYAHPRLSNSNFPLFITAICPSVNTHIRKSPLSTLIRTLDLSALGHQASFAKNVARLLGRTKERLEEFTAPQASLSLHALPALGKCQRLRMLDLRLVTESPPLPDLFRSIAKLHNLHTFRLPRSTGFGVHHKASALITPTSGWPPNISELTLSGGIDAHFLHGVASFPQTLTSLTIEHCATAKSHAVTHLLKTAVRQLPKLETFRIAHMPRLSSHALDDLLFLLPQISTLSVSVDYITPALFDEGRHSVKEDEALLGSFSQPSALCHPNLRTLVLTTSSTHYNPTHDDPKISPLDILIAVDEGALPSLRQVRVAQSLGWHDGDMCTDTEALTDALQEGARRDWERREWVFAREVLGEKEWRAAVFERWGGVWIFEG